MNRLRDRAARRIVQLRLYRCISRAPSTELTDAQREQLLDAIFEDAFIDLVGNEAVAKYGSADLVGGPLLDFLKGLSWSDWLRILLAILPLFLMLKEEQ